MDNYPGEKRKALVRRWNDLIGPVAHLKDLPKISQNDKGLVRLKTRDGTEVYPTFQFDRDADGNVRVNPHIAMAWGLLSSLQVDQMGESEWSKAGMLAQQRSQFDNQSWADVLKDPNISEQDKMIVIKDIVEDAVYTAGRVGLQLTDPRKILPS